MRWSVMLTGVRCQKVRGMWLTQLMSSMESPSRVSTQSFTLETLMKRSWRRRWPDRKPTSAKPKVFPSVGLMLCDLHYVPILLLVGCMHCVIASREPTIGTDINLCGQVVQSISMYCELKAIESSGKHFARHVWVPATYIPVSISIQQQVVECN